MICRDCTPSLKPCPFCGEPEDFTIEEGEESFYVVCTTCEAMSPEEATVAETVAWWNAASSNIDADPDQCPFCGHTDLATRRRNDPASVPYWWVTCRWCGGIGPTCYTSVAGAQAAWQQRRHGGCPCGGHPADRALVERTLYTLQGTLHDLTRTAHTWGLSFPFTMLPVPPESSLARVLQALYAGKGNPEASARYYKVTWGSDAISATLRAAQRQQGTDLYHLDLPEDFPFFPQHEPGHIEPQS